MDFKTANQFIKLSINEKRKYADLLASYIGYKEFTNSDIFKILSSNKKFDKYLFELKINRSDDLDFLNKVFDDNIKTYDLFYNPNLDLKLTEKLVIKHAKNIDSVLYDLKYFKDLNINTVLEVLNLNSRIASDILLIFKDSEKLNEIIDFISKEEFKLDLNNEKFNLITDIIINNFEKLSNNLYFNYSCFNYIAVANYAANSYNKKDTKCIDVICDMFLTYSL